MADKPKHVLIYARREDTAHKFLGPLNAGDRAYWRVGGTPRQTAERARVFFHDGDLIYAEAMITKLEAGRIWFTPLESVRFDHPDRPDGGHRGFQYIEGLPTPTSKHLPR
ncbi:hypothetical protein [Haloferax sulfurifontis]|uniref:Uncharacterized protein n=2 Tax=Haloferax sulfurifontis TaxID=255616 RepID=M0IKT2_9EURY|nr:hypothetical protein [Haloferax sulfurifontis]ELZ96647.1 hypothetical protein C441_04744 [Haloferax sulfurifontis ATCC BAA-897]GGC72270.1 hypothetical protein GCM10007209_37740 [Haloferax sulfurifontis]